MWALGSQGRGGRRQQSRWCFAEGTGSRGELFQPCRACLARSPGCALLPAAAHRALPWAVAASPTSQELERGTRLCVLPKWVQSVLGGRSCFPPQDLPFPPTPEASCAEGAVSSRAWDEKFSRHQTPPSPTPGTGWHHSSHLLTPRDVHLPCFLY